MISHRGKGESGNKECRAKFVKDELKFTRGSNNKNKSIICSRNRSKSTPKYQEVS